MRDMAWASVKVAGRMGISGFESNSIVWMRWETIRVIGGVERLSGELLQSPKKYHYLQLRCNVYKKSWWIHNVLWIWKGLCL
jgi:hypothetical protein